MSVKLKEIKSKRELIMFIRFPDKLYNGCPYYVPSIHSQQLSVLSDEKNTAFRHCEARYWLAFSGKKIVGRIAAIINHRYNTEKGEKNIRFGWLDFIEDKKVLDLLLSAVENWGRDKGMEQIHGPLGFTSFDPAGILVEGFEELPTSWGSYNFPYYKRMLEESGYKKDVDWIEKRITVPLHAPYREIKLSGKVRKRYSLHNADFKTRRDIKKHTGQIFELINSVYGDLYGFSTLTHSQAENLTKEFLPLVKKDYISIVLNKKNEVAAFGLVMPSLSGALRKAKGRLFPFGLFHIIRALNKNDTADMLLIGVKPEYRRKGVHALIFEKIIGNLQKKGIRYVETTRELENNESIRKLWDGYDFRQHKRARCYAKPL